MRRVRALSNQWHTATRNAQPDDEVERIPFWLQAEPDLQLFWKPQSNREERFDRWLVQRAERDFERCLEAVEINRFQKFVADKKEWAQAIEDFVNGMLARLETAEQKQWLAQARKRIDQAEAKMAKDALLAERNLLLSRGVLRGRRTG